MAQPKKSRPNAEDERTPEEVARTRDAILKRMLQTKPKQQKDLVAERRARDVNKSDAPKR
jgi:hypothetical protein